MINNNEYDPSEDPNYIDRFTIGYIEFAESINEQEIGNKNTRINFGKKVGPVKIEVYGSEGAIPHFHIIGVNSNFQSCICIYSANYFAHGGKYRDTLNSKQRELLNEWLKEMNLDADKTNWATIVMVWKMANKDCKFSEKRKVSTQPDYSKIDKFKDI